MALPAYVFYDVPALCPTCGQHIDILRTMDGQCVKMCSHCGKITQDDDILGHNEIIPSLCMDGNRPITHLLFVTRHEFRKFLRAYSEDRRIQRQVSNIIRPVIISNANGVARKTLQSLGFFPDFPKWGYPRTVRLVVVDRIDGERMIPMEEAV